VYGICHRRRHRHRHRPLQSRGREQEQDDGSRDTSARKILPEDRGGSSYSPFESASVLGSRVDNRTGALLSRGVGLPFVSDCAAVASEGSGVRGREHDIVIARYAHRACGFIVMMVSTLNEL